LRGRVPTDEVRKERRADGCATPFERFTLHILRHFFRFLSISLGIGFCHLLFFGCVFGCGKDGQALSTLDVAAITMGMTECLGWRSPRKEDSKVEEQGTRITRRSSRYPAFDGVWRGFPSSKKADRSLSLFHVLFLLRSTSLHHMNDTTFSFRLFCSCSRTASLY